MARTPATRDPTREIGPHEAIAAYLDDAWPEDLPWTHFPAGENRGDHVQRVGADGSTYWFSPSGARLKRMGLKTGWFDFQFVLPNGQFATAEVKAPGKASELSDAQKAHRRALLALKCAVVAWERPEDAERDITRWLGFFGRRPRITLAEFRGKS